jgi:hypothetical protein
MAERIALAVEIVGVFVDLVEQRHLDRLGAQVGRR